MQKNKGIKFFLIIMSVTFLIGVVIGSVYASEIGKEAEKDIYRYLSVFFEKGMENKKEVMMSSMYSNIKVFFIIFLAGFFKPGIPVTLGVGCMEGFTSGFTTATMVKLMGWKGFFLSMSSMLSVVVFVANLIGFGAISMSYAALKDKNNVILKKNYVISAIFAVTIFCIAAFFDGYITTIFMNMIVKKM